MEFLIRRRKSAGEFLAKIILQHYRIAEHKRCRFIETLPRPRCICESESCTIRGSSRNPPGIWFFSQNLISREARRRVRFSSLEANCQSLGWQDTSTRSNHEKDANVKKEIKEEGAMKKENRSSRSYKEQAAKRKMGRKKRREGACEKANNIANKRLRRRLSE